MPSGEKAILQTDLVWPSSIPRGAPVAESQSRIVLSPEPEATSLPSGEKAILQTELVWPSSIQRDAPVAESQSRTVLSQELEAKSLPSGEKATPQTELVWPLSVLRAALVIELALLNSFPKLLAVDELNRLSIALLDVGSAVGCVSRSKGGAIFLVSIADWGCPL